MGTPMGTPEGTRLSRAFCSARDRNVPVLVRDRPEASELELSSCLDYGVRCTGWLCPLFAVPTLPPEGLLEEAIQAERDRRRTTTPERQAILERARKEGRKAREAPAARERRRRKPEH
jgi:hypothetical protein